MVALSAAARPCDALFCPFEIAGAQKSLEIERDVYIGKPAMFENDPKNPESQAAPQAGAGRAKAREDTHAGTRPRSNRLASTTLLLIRRKRTR
jgi:hypothetical protein